MASTRPQLPLKGKLPWALKTKRSSLCLFCSLSVPRARPRTHRITSSPRLQSTSASSTNPRLELQQTLLELEKRYPTLMHISRLQLALQALRQRPGDEAVRVAVLGLTSGLQGDNTARCVLKALLADPLKDEEVWEKELDGYDPTQPLIVRIESRAAAEEDGLTIATSNGLQEMHVPSVDLEGSKLELLLMDIDPMPEVSGKTFVPPVEESLLVPSVEIPAGEGRVTSVTTPVHKAILIADGFAGALHLSALAGSDTEQIIKSAVNMQGVPIEKLEAPFDIVDVGKAEDAIRLFRDGPQNAMAYERLWAASNLPALAAWLKSGIKVLDGTTKPVVRQYITLLLRDALTAIQEQETRKLSNRLQTKLEAPAIGELNEGLALWAQNAHSELQHELDLAFTSSRWRKIGWWKLFWRVDDVAMLTTETLSLRFLPTAEQELVYLAGRIAELGSQTHEYQQPESSRNGLEDPRSLSSEPQEPASLAQKTAVPKWPGHIAFTRRYLQNETVPALQALAQRLVAQSVGTSSIATSLSALLYVSSTVSTLYEAGAVAALGIVYSLARLQKKWGTARDFWESEVREEGRKAVRAAEESVARVLEGETPIDATAGVGDLEQARELVAKAEDALARMR